MATPTAPQGSMTSQLAAIDKQRVVDIFLTEIGGLSRLPFISDDEIARLYGDEVVATLAELGRANDAGRICADCGGKCCRVCGCELYSERFAWCPIAAYRPVVCRLHFCHLFEPAGRRAVIELTDVFFDSLLAAEERNDQRIRLIDSPPLARHAPQLTATASGWMRDLDAGRLSPKRVAALLRREVARFRTADCQPPPVNRT